jgi:hypothetical protein
LNCPACGAQGTFTVWSSLNVTLNPVEKQQLLDGQLTRFTCPNCGTSSNVGYPLLYHDMERQFMLWQLPVPPDQSPSAPPDDLVDVTCLPDGYMFRVVRNLNELREKVDIFEAKLDDRVVEVLKLFVQKHAPPHKLPPGAVMYFAGLGEAVDGRRLMIFVVVKPDRQVSSWPIPLEPGYTDITTELASALATVATRNWQTVNADLAIAMCEGTLPGWTADPPQS